MEELGVNTSLFYPGNCALTISYPGLLSLFLVWFVRSCSLKSFLFYPKRKGNQHNCQHYNQQQQMLVEYLVHVELYVTNSGNILRQREEMVKGPLHGG